MFDGLTPTQRNLVGAMMDGMAHAASKLMKILPDGDMNTPGALTVHITRARKVLRRHGYDIINDRMSGTYRLVRNIGNVHTD